MAYLKANIRGFVKILLNYLDEHYREVQEITSKEENKAPSRTDIINLLIDQFEGETTYLEIGVRNPNDNFNKIKADIKYSVDPGVEFEENPVDFQMTSDVFFEGMAKGTVLKNTLFDVVFIDGLHLAEQVERDVDNALRFVKKNGFIVLHDCNPPSEWHARENYNYNLTPALGYWNGTTWKAFVKARERNDFTSCCVDTDFGVGVISLNKSLGESNQIKNPFWEYAIFNNHRRQILNLMSFEEFKKKLS